MLLFSNLTKEHHQAYQSVVYGIQFSPFLQYGTLAYVCSSVSCFKTLPTNIPPLITAMQTLEKIF